MSTIKIPVFIMAFALFACLPGAENGLKAQVNEEFRRYTIDINQRETPFVNFISELEIMRLEETDDGLLTTYIGDVLEAGDEYIFKNGSEGDIYRYSKSGKFKGKINRRGNGPEEYIKAKNLWIKDGLVSVYILEHRSVKQYRMDGSFVVERSVPGKGAQLIPYKEGYAMDMNAQPLKDSKKHNVWLLDKGLKKTLGLGLYESPEVRSVSTSYNGFQNYKSGLIYVRALSDSLFYLTDNKLRPLMKFDFGENWLWNDKTLLMDRDAGNAAMQTKGRVWNLEVKPGPHWIYLNCITSFRTSKKFMVNKETGEHKLLSFKLSGGEKYRFTPIKWEGDRLLVSMSSEFVSGLIDSLGENQWRFRKGTGLEDIESSENPVLMWVKFKSDLLD